MARLDPEDPQRKPLSPALLTSLGFISRQMALPKKFLNFWLKAVSSQKCIDFGTYCIADIEQFPTRLRSMEDFRVEVRGVRKLLAVWLLIRNRHTVSTNSTAARGFGSMD